MSETPSPQCPTCNGALVPLSDHDRQTLALANAFPWVCPRCFTVGDGSQMWPIEGVKAQERSHFLALIQSFRTIETPRTLLEICEGFRAGLAATSPTRHAWAEVAPELLRELWATMERIGGVTPSSPAVVTTKLGIARDGDDEAYLRKVLDAINDVVRWCEVKQGQPPSGNAKLSPRELASKHGVDAGALRKRLDRWRYEHDAGYIEVSNPAKNEPKYLYDESAVMPVIEAMKAKRVGDRSP